MSDCSPEVLGCVYILKRQISLCLGSTSGQMRSVSVWNADESFTFLMGSDTKMPVVFPEKFKEMIANTAPLTSLHFPIFESHSPLSTQKKNIVFVCDRLSADSAVPSQLPTKSQEKCTKFLSLSTLEFCLNGRIVVGLILKYTVFLMNSDYLYGLKHFLLCITGSKMCNVCLNCDWCYHCCPYHTKF